MFRGLLSIVFAGFLLSIVLGIFKPNAATVDRAMWDVAIIGIAALLYSAVNGFNALRHSMGESSRVVYMGLILSFLPLLVAVYSIAVWQYSPARLSTFQIIAMVFGGLAAVVDVVLFSCLSFGQVRGLNDGEVRHAGSRR